MCVLPCFFVKWNKKVLFMRYCPFLQLVIFAQVFYYFLIYNHCGKDIFLSNKGFYFIPDGLVGWFILRMMRHQGYQDIGINNITIPKGEFHNLYRLFNFGYFIRCYSQIIRQSNCINFSALISIKSHRSIFFTPLLKADLDFVFFAPDKWFFVFTFPFLVLFEIILLGGQTQHQQSPQDNFSAYIEISCNISQKILWPFSYLCVCFYNRVI